MKKFLFPADATKSFNHSIDDMEHQYQLSAEIAEAVAKMLAPTGKVGIIEGVVYSSTDVGGGDYKHDVTAGLVVYNGEVYKVPSFTVTNTSALYSGSLYLVVSEVNAANEPRKLSDNSDFAVRKERTITVTETASGSIHVLTTAQDYRCTDWVDVIPQNDWSTNSVQGGGGIENGFLKWRKYLGIVHVEGLLYKHANTSSGIIGAISAGLNNTYFLARVSGTQIAHAGIFPNLVVDNYASLANGSAVYFDHSFAIR